MNRVWIELERPASGEGDEVAEQRAELANKLMRKLGIEHDVFAWMAEKKTYIHQYSENAGFVYLNDSGEWFNLDYLAK
jgi:hypothetical protein